MARTLQLTEPLVLAMVSLLQTSLPAVITTINATITDGYLIPTPAQYLPYVPVPSTVEGGLPAIGVQRVSSQFQNDTQFRLDALHEYVVVAICQNSDHQTLTWQLERLIQAIAQTIQNDRMAGTPQGSGGTMRNQGGAWSVNLLRTEPGPLLGDLDPTNPEQPPRSYLSWTGLVMSSERGEV